MRNSLRIATFALLTLGVLGLAPQKAAAQWTVFDPSTYSEMAAVWSEDVSTGVKVAQEVQQMTSLLTQTIQIYNLAKTEATMLQKGQVIQAIGCAAVHAAIPGHPQWDQAMTTVGGLAQAGVAWQNMTNPNMSMQNRIAMLTSFGTSTLNSLGSCNAAAYQNGTALGGLQSLAVSMGPANNTAASLGGLNNMNEQQALRYQQCQENLDEQRLKLQLVQAHEALDRDQYTIAVNTKVDQYNSTGGGVWNSSPENDYRLTGMH